MRAVKAKNPSLDTTGSEISHINTAQPFTYQFIPGRLEVRQGHCLNCNDTSAQVDSGRPLLIRLLTLETSSLLSVECAMTVTPLQTPGN